MKKLILILSVITYSSFGQGDAKQNVVKMSGKYDTLTVTPQSLKTLSDFDKKIKELQDQQTLYLRGLFEGRNFDIEKVKDLKFESGKFIFRTEK